MKRMLFMLSSDINQFIYYPRYTYIPYMYAVMHVIFN